MELFHLTWQTVVHTTGRRGGEGVGVGACLEHACSYTCVHDTQLFLLVLSSIISYVQEPEQ